MQLRLRLLADPAGHVLAGTAQGSGSTTSTEGAAAAASGTAPSAGGQARGPPSGVAAGGTGGTTAATTTTIGWMYSGTVSAVGRLVDYGTAVQAVQAVSTSLHAAAGGWARPAAKGAAAGPSGSAPLTMQPLPVPGATGAGVGGCGAGEDAMSDDDSSLCQLDDVAEVLAGGYDGLGGAASPPPSLPPRRAPSEPAGQAADPASPTRLQPGHLPAAAEVHEAADAVSAASSAATGSTAGCTLPVAGGAAAAGSSGSPPAAPPAGGAAPPPPLVGQASDSGDGLQRLSCGSACSESGLSGTGWPFGEGDLGRPSRGGRVGSDGGDGSMPQEGPAGPASASTSASASAGSPSAVCSAPRAGPMRLLRVAVDSASTVHAGAEGSGGASGLGSPGGGAAAAGGGTASKGEQYVLYHIDLTAVHADESEAPLPVLGPAVAHEGPAVGAQQQGQAADCAGDGGPAKGAAAAVTAAAVAPALSWQASRRFSDFERLRRELEVRPRGGWGWGEAPVSVDVLQAQAQALVTCTGWAHLY